jgi:hypothetical protein
VVIDTGAIDTIYSKEYSDADMTRYFNKFEACMNCFYELREL